LGSSLRQPMPLTRDGMRPAGTSERRRCVNLVYILRARRADWAGARLSARKRWATAAHWWVAPSRRMAGTDLETRSGLCSGLQGRSDRAQEGRLVLAAFP
jgi:hypothetical protein